MAAVTQSLETIEPAQPFVMLRPFDIVERRPLWHPELPFVVFWSHKSACTTIAQWFFALIGSPQRQVPGDRRHGFRGLRIHGFEAIYKERPDYLPGCVAALAAGRPAIKFVRDPAARAFSAYLSTCETPAMTRQGFWGAKVRAKIIAWRGSAARDSAYSFVDFVEWLGSIDVTSINMHVRAQRQAWEDRLSPEIVPIEGLQGRLGVLERRFGLPAASEDPDIFVSGHHRTKSVLLAGIDLERELAKPIAVHPRGSRPLPRVDSQSLAGTKLGLRLREVLAIDYAAYPIY